MKKKYLSIAAGFGVALFFINALALKFYWYVSIPWFDHFTHFLGGLFIIFLLVATFFHPLINASYGFLKVILIVFFIGVLWELYELIVQMVVAVDLVTLKDSLRDLFFDTLGGLVGWFTIRKKQNTLL